jgi:DNA topoisomerase-1
MAKAQATNEQTAANEHPENGEAAAAAGLHYVTDQQPGITRRRAGTGWSYWRPDGSLIRDKRTIDRIKSLAIPPAYTEVWICPDPQGHLQATGRDAKGRKQYRYHPDWNATRNETKFERLVAFGEALPAIRAQIETDLARPGLPREKVLATVVRLLETTLIRIGNDEYAKTNRSFGLTTMKDRHAEVEGSTIRFVFRGKSGRDFEIDLRDRRLARIVGRCQALPGQELLQYQDEDGSVRDVGSSDVNDYLREISAQPFTAKDFRTWAGTVLAALALQEAGPAESETAAKLQVVAAVDAVAERLGNTRAVCRASYIHPAIIEAYLNGSLDDDLKRQARDAPRCVRDGLLPEEVAVLGFLRAHSDRTPQAKGQRSAARR